ncbi:NUDIX domain-containing protein [Streptomyces flaveolus]|uniref:NUDIX hydrolase n=1 Tax=Streptomyces flaveolus TaxID=67297 RepID=UPI0033A02257
MSLRQAEGVVRAVVVCDGRLLLVLQGEGWTLPSGAPDPAESAQATAARIVHELTGYLVDGTEPLVPRDSAGETAVVCQLLSESPSDGGRFAPEQVRWAPIEETAGTPLPASVRTYLRGHTPA